MLCTHYYIYFLFLWPFVIRTVYSIEKSCVVKKTHQETHSEIKASIESIRRSCGDVCNTTMTGTPGKHHPFIAKKIDCQELFSNPDIDAPGNFDWTNFPLAFKQNPDIKGKVPDHLPAYLVKEFSYNRKVKLIYSYKDESHTIGQPTIWHPAHVNRLIEQVKNGVFEGAFGKEEVANIEKHLRLFFRHMQGTKILVIGDLRRPWLEAILLANGADKVTSLAFSNVTSLDPRINVISPQDMAVQFLNGSLPLFDYMVTFGALQTQGLGRYGECLNPWADLITMARSWCVLKPGGQVLVAAPYAKDTLRFNLNRVYGPLMHSHLFANWQVVYTNNNNDDLQFVQHHICDDCYQPIYILEKLNEITAVP